MAATDYMFSIQNDFPNHKVNTTRLTQEIQRSSIITALDHIDTVGDSCNIWFKNALSTGDETTLDGIVATHSGEPLPDDIPSPVKLYSGTGTPSPTTTDGRPIALSNIFPDYVTLYHTGAGDDATLGRGSGTPFTVASDAAGDTAVDFSFLDWVYIAGGRIRYIGAVLGDYVNFETRAPATPVTANGSNTGNCNLVDPGVGAAVLIVPAAGNGAFNVDLTHAVPIPALNTEQPREYIGYYNWSAPDTGPGVITAGAPGASGYNLFAVAIDPLARFVNKISMLGDDNDDLTIAAIAPKTFLPQWLQRVTVHNSGHAGLKVVFRIVTARVKTT